MDDGDESSKNVQIIVSLNGAQDSFNFTDVHYSTHPLCQKILYQPHTEAINAWIWFDHLKNTQEERLKS